MNLTDTSHMNENEISKLLVDAGGDKISLACDNYIEENGPLKLEDVISLSSGNLRSFFLFHVVLLNSEKHPPQKTLESALYLAVYQACTNNCKSLSIHSVKFQQSTINEILDILRNVALKNHIKPEKTLQIIRIVGTHMTTLKLYQKALCAITKSKP